LTGETSAVTLDLPVTVAAVATPEAGPGTEQPEATAGTLPVTGGPAGPELALAAGALRAGGAARGGGRPRRPAAPPAAPPGLDGRPVTHGRRLAPALAMAAVLIAALLASAAQSPAATADTNAPCADNDGVTVVVDFHELGGGVQVRCAPQPVTDGFSALRQA